MHNVQRGHTNMHVARRYECVQGKWHSFSCQFYRSQGENEEVMDTMDFACCLFFACHGYQGHAYRVIQDSEMMSGLHAGDARVRMQGARPQKSCESTLNKRPLHCSLSCQFPTIIYLHRVMHVTNACAQDIKASRLASVILRSRRAYRQMHVSRHGLHAYT